MNYTNMTLEQAQQTTTTVILYYISTLSDTMSIVSRSFVETDKSGPLNNRERLSFVVGAKFTTDLILKLNNFLEKIGSYNDAESLEKDFAPILAETLDTALSTRKKLDELMAITLKENGIEEEQTKASEQEDDEKKIDSKLLN